MQPKNSSPLPLPPDQNARIAALDAHSSVLVQAPAGSGKTDLLTRRFLRLLAEVDDPAQIVAITFTRAAAAEMRHRILAELQKAAEQQTPPPALDEFSMEALAARALARSNAMNWRLLDLASQLRISTIDSFCRDLAIQQPIFSGIGSGLEISEQPTALYRRAARLTLQMLGSTHNPELSGAIRDLLLWRDNGWKELEDLLVKMLGQRDRWMHEFLLSRNPDWDALREQLERPFSHAVQQSLAHLYTLLDRGPNVCNRALELARFACEQTGGRLHQELAELSAFPCGPFHNTTDIEDARHIFECLGTLLLTNDGKFRQRFDKNNGFPADRKLEKQRIQNLVTDLDAIPGLETALASIRDLPPARYTDEDWQIVRASFVLLRHAAGELKAVFAEAGSVDFVEVAQIAKQVLLGEDNLPSDAALAVADDIRHLLVDEFQDTSRRQHEFITSLIAAWPDRSDRTIFVVGDPMQSIYFFRDAEAELFGRVKDHGFEFGDGETFPLSPVQLKANFRTDPALVSNLNHAFQNIFAQPDGSGIDFAEANPAREPGAAPHTRFQLHIDFMPQLKPGNSSNPESMREKQQIAQAREAAESSQISEIVSLIRTHLDSIEEARANGKKYRVAVLGRARTALAPIAAALREAAIPFRAVELETLGDRPEILDAVALARALFNPENRVAWLGVLRAPWCGLDIAELHTIVATDDSSQLARPIPQLLHDRIDFLSPSSRAAVNRVLAAFAAVPGIRAKLPTASVGTLIQQLWRSLGGDSCVDNAARANLSLFWKLLDELPGGEQDLLGPALETALKELCALPDPETSSEHGVQLMTIHKSKGLEFEVVIVPDLHARNGRNKIELLSWLERGISDPDESGELTEFLIAPLQFKGTDPGKAKRWVDNARLEREKQETRRILYVACTRAREELHLFALPSYKTEADASLALLEPSNCLLATAWPALGDEIRARFDTWQHTAPDQAGPADSLIETIAAASESNLIVMPAVSHPATLRRLPQDFQSRTQTGAHLDSLDSVVGLSDAPAYQRHEGGLRSRALGNAIHKLLEQLAQLRTVHDWDTARSALSDLQPYILSQVRSAGIAASEAKSITDQAFDCALAATRDPHGDWILSPHTEAASESAWAGVISGNVRLVRVDRLFRAGLEPFQPGDDALWIIDYKTGHADAIDPATALRALRATFAPQLQTYAAVLRNLHGPGTQLRAGLYYPRMSLFDWWEL